MSDVTEPTLGDRLAASLEAFDPGVDERTIMRFDITFDEEGDKKYTYAAIYVNRKWYVTGGSVLSKEYEHADFMKVLAKWQATNVELALTFDTIR